MTMEVKEEEKLAENLEAAGNALLSRPDPSSVDQLLLLLDKLEKYLLETKQSASNYVQKALRSAMNALTTKELLNNLNVDVKVSVASCSCEIMRCTAPDAPCGDEQLKEIFKLIVAAFDNISDISSPSYKRRLSILETFARIKLWVIMLDLQLDSLILEMFKAFIRNLRENHPQAVFLFMGYIMIMVLEEVEEVSPELLSPILGSLRKGNQSVLPITRKLGERVIENCVSKLVPYMGQAVQYMGFPLDDYGKFVAYICAQNRGTLDHNKVNPFQDTSAKKHPSSCNQGICNSSSVNQSLKSGHVWSQQWRGRKVREGKSRMKKACLAPDDGKPFVENLIGSRIKVWCVEEHASYEGDVVSYDPKEKKHKVRYANGDEKMLLLEKEWWKFVGDGSGASREKLANSPNLDASCEMHQNKKPKMNSNFPIEETIRREGISKTALDIKISGKNNSESIENAIESENKTSEVGHTDSAVESEDGVGGVCSMPEESSIDNIGRSNDDPLKPRAVKECNTTNSAIDCEDKNEKSTLLIGTLSKNLVPANLTKRRSPRHQMMKSQKQHGTPN
eukprot:XP_015577470.1 uncharacterized protein LOC8282502 isoform X2 [Ricinus communis]